MLVGVTQKNGIAQATTLAGNVWNLRIMDDEDGVVLGPGLAAQPGKCNGDCDDGEPEAEPVVDSAPDAQPD